MGRQVVTQKDIDREREGNQPVDSLVITLDTFHYHEISDRCHLINCMIDDFILAHPACNTQMQYWAEDAQRQLCNIMSMAAVEEEKLDRL